ncbi:MAG: DUF3037 domain-containing protein [Acidobacteriota bacterium]|nr:DUF3037 domain-containing protein [Acidobacteriota bacterium]
MPALNSFDYAIIRVVPRVERGEFLNAGVIVFCLEKKFLEARIELDTSRLLALWPDADAEVLGPHLQAFADICAGATGAGPIAELSQRERFHWLVAPRSTVIQISPVHTGLCADPQAALTDLIRQFLRT